jgi:hypothetical protein
MDIPLRAPRNRTAELQLILRHVAQGYIYWTADQIPKAKLPGFITKWADLRLLADPAARSWRKQSGRANAHIVLAHEMNATEQNSESDHLHWILLGTAGKEGLTGNGKKPGVIRDATTKEGRIVWKGYELVRQQKTFKTKDGRQKSELTWTWRIVPVRFKEWEAHIHQSAKQRDYAALQQTFGILSRLPLFAGIRSQIEKLHFEANKMLNKVGGNPMPPLKLPFVTLAKIWA